MSKSANQIHTPEVDICKSKNPKKNYWMLTSANQINIPDVDIRKSYIRHLFQLNGVPNVDIVNQNHKLDVNICKRRKKLHTTDVDIR